MSHHDNLQKIKVIRRQRGEQQFRCAIQYLFDTGHQNFNEKNVARVKVKIEKNTPANAIMTAGFQCEIMDACLELSKLPVWDVILYVKLYLSMDGDDILLFENAERNLRAWSPELGPQSWRDACKDPDMRQEILQEMVKQHQDEFSIEEIKSAICSVVNEL